MKKSLSILLGIGILVGVWVYKTHAPTALNPLPVAEQKTASDPVPVEHAPSATPAQVAAGSSKEKPMTPVQKIATTLKESDARKLLILDEILRSKNDNDPRLDNEYKAMTPELKRAMTQFYKSIPMEGRNERGTIVFLVARNMNSSDDVNFMKEVLMEKPCLSLGDCSKSAPASTEEEKHLDGINETTANYPQLTGLNQSLEQYRRLLGLNPPDTATADKIVAMFHETARNAPNPQVTQYAEKILSYIHR